MFCDNEAVVCDTFAGASFVFRAQRACSSGGSAAKMRRTLCDSWNGRASLPLINVDSVHHSTTHLDACEGLRRKMASSASIACDQFEQVLVTAFHFLALQQFKPSMLKEPSGQLTHF